MKTKKQGKHRERVFEQTEADAINDVAEAERRVRHKAVYGVESFEDSDGEEESPPTPLQPVKEVVETSDAEESPSIATAAVDPVAPSLNSIEPEEEPYRLSLAEQERLQHIREERDRANRERELIKLQRAEQAAVERQLLEEKRLRNAKFKPKRR